MKLIKCLAESSAEIFDIVLENTSTREVFVEIFG